MKHYCGPPKAWSAAKKGPIPKKLLEQYKKKYGIAYSYQKLIADSNGLEPFDEVVVEAYWIGNELLDKVRTLDLRKMYRRDYSWNKPIARILEATPDGAKPYHNFHAMSVFTVLGMLDKTIENQKQCMILPGRVVDDKTVKLMDDSLRGVNIVFEKVRRNDLVVVHWDAIPQKIDKRQLANLKNITGRHAELLKCDWVSSML
jgi:hypothetical protein